VAAAKCKVCEAKSETIRALELANQTLLEMVNLQRAIPRNDILPDPPEKAVSRNYPALVPVESADEDDPEEIMARLNDPGLPEEDAEQLMAQLQALNTRVERAD
jgi:hypothetical protein